MKKRTITTFYLLSIITIFFCLTARTCFTAEAQSNSGDSPEGKSADTQYGVCPIIFYSDETRFVGGGAAQVMHKKNTDKQTSSVGILGIYTQNNQYNIAANPEIYLKTGKYKISGNVDYSFFPDVFYGIGNDTDKDDKEDYTLRSFRIDSSFQVKLISNLYTGIRYRYLNTGISETESGGLLRSGYFNGSEGGEISGTGITITWDSRDNNLYPFSGSFHQFSATVYRPEFGSDYSFNSYICDMRHYCSVFGKHIIAFQGIAGIKTGKPPFQVLYETGSLGAYLRGYNNNRFIDKNIVAFQTEYRMPVYKNFGLVGFAGFGQVAESVNDFGFKDFKPSAGMGLRFALIPEDHVNLRIDMGVGKDDTSFDINIMELF